MIECQAEQSRKRREASINPDRNELVIEAVRKKDEATYREP